VWRIKYIEQQDILLMACMQDGVKVVQFNSTSSMSIIDEMRENHSLAYGIDWCRSEAKPRIAASCSFYDKIVSVWTI